MRDMSWRELRRRRCRSGCDRRKGVRRRCVRLRRALRRARLRNVDEPSTDRPTGWRDQRRFVRLGHVLHGRRPARRADIQRPPMVNPVSIDPKEQLEAVSCVSAQFCVAVAWDRSYVYDGTSGRKATACARPGQLSLTTLACAFDNALFRHGRRLALLPVRRRRWKSFTLDPYEITALACAGPTFCVASDYRGGVMTFDGTRWSQPQGVDSTGLQSISCPSSTFCVGRRLPQRRGLRRDLVDLTGSCRRERDDVGRLSWRAACVAVDRLGDAVA